MPAARRALTRALAGTVAVASLLAPVWRSGTGAGAAPTDPTTTTEPPTSTTVLPGPPGSTTTTGPAPSSTTATTRDHDASTTSSLPVSPDHGGDESAPGADHTVPPAAQKIINAYKRTKPNDTKALMAALNRLAAFGFTPQQAALFGFGRFPVAGPANFVDDWIMPRFTPVFHMHEGTDIWANRGTPVRAPYDGVLTFLDEPVGGIDEFVTLPDKTYFFFAHLSARAKITPGSTVKAGQVIGFVGNSGDASDGPTHLHFEIHPKGGAAVNPKPFLDRWLAEALAAVPGLIADLVGSTPRSIRATGLTRSAGGAGMFEGPSGPSEAELLWAGPLSPSGPLQLAAREAVRLAQSYEWG
jgi:murein DD-endopeptidase MepM/ murein hydrolase activator NlpD